MALFRPGIAEIDEEAVDFTGLKNIFQSGDITAQELHIIDFGIGTLLAGIIEDPGLNFNADKVDVRGEAGPIGK